MIISDVVDISGCNWAVTKSGTGTWDLGREDSGTPGRGTRGHGDLGLGDAGTWDSGTRGRGTRGRGDVGTRGRGDVGTWRRGDVGLGTRGRGTWDSGLGDVAREDVINKKHPNDPLNLQFTVFVI